MRSGRPGEEVRKEIVMKRRMALFLIVLLAGMAAAVPGRGFWGDIDGYLMVTSEDDIVS